MGVIVRVCYRPPGQDHDADKLFEELRDTCKSMALVLMGDFNLPEISWEYHRDGTTWARRLKKTLDDNLMKQILREPTQMDALLDLLLVTRVDLMSKVQFGQAQRTIGESEMPSVLKQLLPMIKSYNERTNDDYTCEDFLVLLVYIYSVVGEIESGKELDAAEEELKKALVKAICDEPEPSPLLQKITGTAHLVYYMVFPSQLEWCLLLDAA
ncbi:hypothetical protein WISP_108312 [Willisornis vidua]|uniref:Endonuclease/exonuclease/phosphatase domain-containing protein n=1 Tax=Willisornis vidua TaxID=1566151 RepID=A0ABQ9D0Z6_9PASS|nr:hypothetical protein WISP_108312 [Willisornis vidua]